MDVAATNGGGRPSRPAAGLAGAPRASSCAQPAASEVFARVRAEIEARPFVRWDLTTKATGEAWPVPEPREMHMPAPTLR